MGTILLLFLFSYYCNSPWWTNQHTLPVFLPRDVFKFGQTIFYIMILSIQVQHKYV